MSRRIWERLTLVEEDGSIYALTPIRYCHYGQGDDVLLCRTSPPAVDKAEYSDSGVDEFYEFIGIASRYTGAGILAKGLEEDFVNVVYFNLRADTEFETLTRLEPGSGLFATCGSVTAAPAVR